MPGLSGFEILVPQSNPPPIRCCPSSWSRMNDVQSVDRAYRAGATDFIVKPITWALIAHRVRYLLRSYEAVLDLRAAED